MLAANSNGIAASIVNGFARNFGANSTTHFMWWPLELAISLLPPASNRMPERLAMFARAALFATLMVTPASASTPSPPPLVIGLPYKATRARLIGAGNHPVQVRPGLGLKGMCLGRDDLCAAYPEVESCAVDRDGPCRFRWRTAKGRLFIVYTVGGTFDVTVSGDEWDD